MSLSDDLRRMADRVTEMERALEDAEETIDRLGKELSEEHDRTHSMQCLRGLEEQARNALLMCARYVDEGDDFATSERILAAFRQAVECVVDAAKEAA